MEQPATRRRGRPRQHEGPGLTRDGIAETALQIAGDEGFAAVTMHRLAATLDVTPSALYNHVRDRQEVVDLAAALLLQRIPEEELDPSDWQASLRRHYRQAREVYLRHPRAILIGLEESVTDLEVDVRRIDLAEHMLQFGVDIGLTLEQAIAVRGTFLTDVFGFSLLVDYTYDRAADAVRPMLAHPVPEPWLEAHPNHPAPLSRRAIEQPTQTSDDLFEAMVELRIVGLEALLGSPREHIVDRMEGWR